MVGGRDFKTQQFNVAVQGSGRQPGSAFKPFVLATALANGVSPEQTFESGPIELPVGDKIWSVTGRKRRTHRADAAAEGDREVGELRLRPAHHRGRSREGRRDGRRTWGCAQGMKPVPAIALGGTETGVTPLEMATAFATLAAGGKHATPYGIADVKDASGKVLFSAKPKTDEALDPAVAYLTTDILKGVISDGTGTGADIGRPAAGKTGTTQENRDAWFVGYTPQLATAVWMGYPGGADGNVERARPTGHRRLVPCRDLGEVHAGGTQGPGQEGLHEAGRAQGGQDLPRDRHGCHRVLPPHRHRAAARGHRAQDLHEAREPTKITVPNLVGMSKEEALALLGKLKLKSAVDEKSVKGVPAGDGRAARRPRPGARPPRRPS